MITVVGGYGQGLTMRVERIPAAGETVAGGLFSSDHGGKGSNQAVAVRRLGGTSRIITALGDDIAAGRARELWAAEGVADSAVVCHGHATMTGFILVDPSGENRICIADGALAALTAADIAVAMADAPAQILLVSLEIGTDAAHAALRLAHDDAVLTILNPAPADARTVELLEVVDILTPNRGELATLAAVAEPRTVDEVRAVCAGLRERTGYAGAIVVTMGADGVLVDHDGGSEHVEPITVPRVVDTTGAGDTFSAALAVALHEQTPFLDAARFAAAAGALCVTREEVIPSLPYRADVDRLISSGGRFS